MLSERDVETLRVRLELLDALVVMLVTQHYAERRRQTPDLDIARMASRDVRHWFDILDDMPGFAPDIRERESLRLLRAVEKQVEHLAPPDAAPR